MVCNRPADVVRPEKLRLLFICLGNICRSPAAHAVMQHKIDEGRLSERFYVDSAGIGGWHVGQLPDKRMREHGYRRGYRIDHRARQFDASEDFRRFDYIIVMDHDNYNHITSLSPDEKHRKKVLMMADFFTRHDGETIVPDPYYGDGSAFEYALDLIEDGCEGLLRHFK